MMSRTPLDADPRIETVDPAELVASGQVVPAVPEVPSKRVVSCPYPGAEICVGHTQDPLPERQEGDVWVRGLGVTDGHLNTSREGGLVDGWLRLGDLGYMADGELWVTGRADGVVVLHGEKHHPEDIERAVWRATGLRPSACAAFSGGFVVVLETGSPPDGLAHQASTAITNAIGFVPVALLVVAPGTIPTTQRQAPARQAARAVGERVVGMADRRIPDRGIAVVHGMVDVDPDLTDLVATFTEQLALAVISWSGATGHLQLRSSVSPVASRPGVRPVSDDPDGARTFEPDGGVTSRWSSTPRHPGTAVPSIPAPTAGVPVERWSWPS